MALAGVLALVAIYLYITRPGKKQRAIDAGISGPMITPIGTPDAIAADADAWMMAPLDAGAPADTATAIADAVPADADAKPDPVVRAKELYDQAFAAFEDGRIEKAIDLVDASLRLRRTARSYLLRARAFQRLGSVDEALASLDSAEQTFKIPAIYEARARILKAAGRNDEARAAIMKYLEMVPDRGPTVKQFKQWLEELP